MTAGDDMHQLLETSAQKQAKLLVKEALQLIVEARRELTIYQFQRYVAENIDDLGGRGYVASIGGALTEAATITASYSKIGMPQDLMPVIRDKIKEVGND